MKKLIFISFFLMNVVSVFAQGDYFIIDNKKIEGIKIRNRDALGNSQFCEHIVGIGAYAESILYRPDQIKEYGFANGTTYFSREILEDGQLKGVFLERIYGEDFNLFVLPTKKGRRFFIESEDVALTELEEDNYRPLLMSVMTECPVMEDALQQVRLRKYSLLKILDTYKKCELTSFPHPRWGAHIGLNPTTLKPREIKFIQLQIVGIEDLLFDYRTSPTVGVFVDLPINASEFSVHAKLFVDFYRFTTFRAFSTYLEEIKVDFTSVNFPFLYRYTHQKGKIRPFFNVGGILSSHLMNDNFILERSLDGSLINSNELVSPKILHDNYFGYILGGGLLYDLNPKHSIMVDIQYHRQAPINSNISVAKQGYLLLLGYSF